MKLYTSPDPTIVACTDLTLFLAGSITGCIDWQKDIITMIKGNVSLYNPRRENFPIHDPTAAAAQIKWEYERLKQADMISFWFADGSLGPITLFELGMWGLSRDTAIFIGCDPNYARRADVIIQAQLARPEIEVVSSIEALALEINQCVEWCDTSFCALPCDVPLQTA